MSNIYEFPKETLAKMKEALPMGGIQTIADKTKYHRNYVARVLKGECPLNANNMEIIRETQKMLREAKNEVAKITEATNQIINPVSDATN